MPRDNIANRNDFTVVSRLGPRTRDATVAAAANMALADGRVEPVEHRGLLTFLKQQDMLLAFGRADIMQRYVTNIGLLRSAGGLGAYSGMSTMATCEWAARF
jgi:tellurite resistance protein